MSLERENTGGNKTFFPVGSQLRWRDDDDGGYRPFYGVYAQEGRSECLEAAK